MYKVGGNVDPHFYTDSGIQSKVLGRNSPPNTYDNGGRKKEGSRTTDLLPLSVGPGPPTPDRNLHTRYSSFPGLKNSTNSCRKTR